MRVGLHGEGDLGVAEQFGDIPRTHALRQQQCRRRVPKIMEPDRRKPQFRRRHVLALWFGASDRIVVPQEVSRIKRCADPGGEYVHRFLPSGAGPSYGRLPDRNGGAPKCSRKRP